ncbi:MAG: hypothetical protein WEB67_05680, partial [Acidimicrobiia bacterium]
MTRTGLVIVAAVLLVVACDAATAPLSTIQTPDSSVTSENSTTPRSTTSTLAATTTTQTPSTTVDPRGWLVIHGTGDVNLDGDVIGALRTNGYGHAWSGLGGLFGADDLTVINLECSPSPDGPPEPKEY